jgi:effector-binding domain-containing protein
MHISPMGVDVSVQSVSPRLLAAINRKVPFGQVGIFARPALDQVWAFLRAQPGLRTDGHNIFLYGHPTKRGDPMDVDFGVEVVRTFEPAGEIRPVWTPAGEVATALHIGPYEKLHPTHQAVHAWMDANRRQSAGWSWEIYGDWTEDPSKLETTIMYLLK